MDEQLFLEQIEPRGEAVSTAPKLLWNSVTFKVCVGVGGRYTTEEEYTGLHKLVSPEDVGSVRKEYQ